MKVNYKAGLTEHCFGELKYGDVFIAAEQMGSPTGKRIPYMKVFIPDGKESNAVNLLDGHATFAPCEFQVIKCEAELSVSL